MRLPLDLGVEAERAVLLLNLYARVVLLLNLYAISVLLLNLYARVVPSSNIRKFLRLCR